MRRPSIIRALPAILACLTVACASPADRGPAVEVVAHRGNSSVAPENTLAAVRAALELDPPPPWIEIDVHLSADGRPMVIHDATLERTCGRPGVVAQLASDELGEIGAGYPDAFGDAYAAERIPTLEQVLDAVAGTDTGVMIEVKVHRAGAPVARLVAERDEAHRHLVASFHPDVLVAASQACPSLRTLFLVGEPGPEHVELARRIGASILGAGHRSATPELAAATRAAGLSLWVWTVDDLAQAQGLADLGVEAVITNRPGPWIHELRGGASGHEARESGS